MRHRSLLNTALFVASLAIAGCAEDAVRVESATSLSAKGSAAVAAARDYLAKVGAEQEAANLDYIALDPACRPDKAWLRTPPDYDRTHLLAEQKAGWLCSAVEIKDKSVLLRLGPADRELTSAFLMLKGLSGYFAGITGILAQDGPSTATDFTESVGVLTSAQALVAAAGKRNLPGSAELVATAEPTGKLLALMDQMRKEKQQVAALDTFVKDNDAADRLIASASTMLEAWDASRSAAASARTTNAFLVLEETPVTTGAVPAGATPASRARTTDASEPIQQANPLVQRARDYYSRADEEFDGAKLYPVLAATFNELAAADKAMRNALAGHLDAKQRAEVAHLTRQRVGAALDALTTILATVAKAAA